MTSTILIVAAATVVTTCIAAASPPKATPAGSPPAAPAQPDPAPTLREQLEARKQEFARRAPAETARIYDEGVKTVAESGVMETAKKLGDTAPDFTLPDPTGDQVRLTELLKEGPVVLMWYRGGWCPYCNLQLHAMQDQLPEMEKLGASLVAISPEKPDFAMTTTEKNELGFTVVSDVGNKTAADYGIKYTLPAPVAESFKGRLDLEKYNGDASNELPLTAVYIIGQDRQIKWRYLSPDYRERAEPSEIVAALRTLAAPAAK